MPRFAPGQIVVCTRTNDPKYSFLVGACGEVIFAVPSFISEILEADYDVVFPQYRGQECPRCHKDHKGHFAMSHNELKALDDPDKGVGEQDDKELPKPVFGFAL